MTKFIRTILAVLVSFAWSVYPVMHSNSAFASVQGTESHFEGSRHGKSVKLSWKTLDADSRVEVLRDGIEIYSGTGAGSLEENPVSDSSISYQFKMSRIPKNSDLTAFNPRKRAEIISNRALFEYSEILGFNLDPDETQILNADSAKASITAVSTALRYATFIPQQFVSAPALGCTATSFSDEYFLGDSRTFSTSSSRNRTRFDVTVNWNALSMTSTTDVGITNVYQLYNGVYNFVTFDRAPATSMILTQKSISSSKAMFNMQQDVANPFCSSNGIFFNYDVSIFRSGAYSMVGSRLQSPSHEIYIKDSDSAVWKTILQNNSFNLEGCLTPVVSGLLGCLSGTTLSGNR